MDNTQTKPEINISNFLLRLKYFEPSKGSRKGFVKALKASMIIEVTLPDAKIGERCVIRNKNGKEIRGQVIGFDENSVYVTPLDPVMDLSPGSLVLAEGCGASIKVGNELLGQIVDCFGRTLEHNIELSNESTPLNKPIINPLKRKRITNQLSVGVKALDLFTPVGEGQRLGIFSTAGQGKSTLLGMLAQSSEADINVIALIGERGREVLDFIEDNLGPEGLKKSIVVVSTSDELPMRRILAAYTATAIAEHFRDQGKKVLLIMDSITRFARALRELALALGEAPARQGYPPSVFSVIPELLERAGQTEKGSITAFYSVLLNSEKIEDPLAEEVRAILDGHINLSSEMYNLGVYPAIDVLRSNSRLALQVTNKEEQETSAKLRLLLSTYENNKDLVSLGAYKKGSDKLIDEALEKRAKILEFLKQDPKVKTTKEDAFIEAGRIVSL